MARPSKKTVDFFPHDVTSGKTIFTLESLYQNDGYAFWFKLLELLGQAEAHYYDCTTPASWRYLLARTRVAEGTATDILNLLAELEAIDPELWQHKIIWCQNFVDRLGEVYRKRQAPPPARPTAGKPPKAPKGQEQPPQPEQATGPTPQETFEQFWQAYPRRVGKKPCLAIWCRLKPNEQLLAKILQAIENSKRAGIWNDPKFIPHPQTWLNKARWEDELPGITPPAEDDLHFLK